MSINLTLIVQMLVFIVLVWFTMKFVWPMILGPMEERSKKIAQGLAAADKGEQSLVHAKEQADGIIREARERASQIIDQAQHRANEMIEEAKGIATTDANRIKAQAEEQVVLEASQARETLRREVGQIAVAAAAKLLEREIDPKAHADLINKLATQI
jgi:F-type H+-transporting ATPase subunit b